MVLDMIHVELFYFLVVNLLKKKGILIPGEGPTQGLDCSYTIKSRKTFRRRSYRQYEKGRIIWKCLRF